MFLMFLQHGHHLTGPLAVLVPAAMVALRLFMRRSRAGRGSRGHGGSGR